MDHPDPDPDPGASGKPGAPASPAHAALLGGIPVADHLSRGDLLAGRRRGEIGSVHSWELVTAVDGPGTRMTTFLAGCPLRCLYCHNPDTLTANRGVWVLAEDLLARIRRYRGVFRATGGGITLSGGEVLQQPEFAATLLRGARQMGIHTAIDTSGFLGRNASDALLADVDLVLLDVKAGDEDTYRRVTGRQLQPTLDFGHRLSDLGIETWIRFVLVPGLTDDPATIVPIADFAATLDSVTRVEVLPFHQMGRAKWAELGLDYQLDQARAPDPAQIEAVRAIFGDRGLTVY